MSEENVSSIVGGTVEEAPVGDQAGSISDIVNSESQPTQSWMGETISDDNRGWIENKGFSDVEALTKSYRALESHMGVSPDKLIKLPSEGEDMSEVYNRLGRPESKDGYVYPEGFERTELSNLLDDVGFEEGMTASMHSRLLEGALEIERAQAEAYQAQKVEAHNAEVDSMKNEWGGKYDEVIDSADRAVRAMGLDDATRDGIIDAIGIRKTVEFFNKVYSTLREDTVNSINNEESYGRTPQAIDQEMSQLIRDVGADPARYQAFQSKAGTDYERYQTLQNTRKQYD